MSALEFMGKLFALQVKMLVPYAIAVMVLLIIIFFKDKK